MSYLLGIDLGTSSVKAMLIDTAGHTIGVAAENYDINIPAQNRAEQDPYMWWEHTVKSIRRVLSETSTSPETIKSIGLSGQMHGLVALNRRGEPVRSAIIWADQRATEELDEMQALVKGAFTDYTHNVPAGGFLLPSLYWVKKHEKACYENIATVLLPKDYIRYRLCGELATDHSDASASLGFDIVAKRWAVPLLKSLDIDETLFPETYGSCEIAGEVTEYASKECGLKAGTPVVYGGGDLFMQSIGNGIVSPGIAASNIGTASQIFMPTEEAISDPNGRIQSYCYTIEGMWSAVAASLNGGVCLKWLQNNFLSDYSFKEIGDLAAQAPAGAEDLIFLPYLAGERTPHMNPNCRAVFFGMGLNHGKAHFARSVMEGVVFALSDCLQLMEQFGAVPEKIVASGGGASDALWLQIQADMFGRPIYKTKVKEQACCGAALAAGVGVGIYKDLQEACGETVQLMETYTQPNMENHRFYREKLHTFQEIYKANETLFYKNGGEHYAKTH